MTLKPIFGDGTEAVNELGNKITNNNKDNTIVI
jgi:hypothetical protein